MSGKERVVAKSRKKMLMLKRERLKSLETVVRKSKSCFAYGGRHKMGSQMGIILESINVDMKEVVQNVQSTWLYRREKIQEREGSHTVCACVWVCTCMFVCMYTYDL